MMLHDHEAIDKNAIGSSGRKLYYAINDHRHLVSHSNKQHFAEVSNHNKLIIIIQVEAV